MLSFFKRQKKASHPRTIIIKPEIDYDQLAEKFIKAIDEYQLENVVTEDTIFNALKRYDEFKDAEEHKKQEKDIKNGTLWFMKQLLFIVYLITAICITVTGSVLCKEYCMKENTLESTVFLGLMFWAVVSIFIILCGITYNMDSKDKIERHFSIFTSVVTLLIAILTLIYTIKK